jgi:hypothetical protein
MSKDTYTYYFRAAIFLVKSRAPPFALALDPARLLSLSPFLPISNFQNERPHTAADPAARRAEAVARAHAQGVVRAEPGFSTARGAFGNHA